MSKRSPTPPSMVVFTGKGGSGKSTLSVCLAVHAVQRNLSVRVLSLDLAHSTSMILKEVLECEEADRSRGGLEVIEPDYEALSRTWLAELSGQVEERYRYLTSLNLGGFIETIRLSPGVHEHILCRELYRELGRPSIDGNSPGLLLLDMPATSSFLNLVSYVLSAEKWLMALGELHRRIQVDHRFERSVVGIEGEEPVEAGRGLSEKLVTVRELISRIKEAFSAPSTAFVSVVNPEPLSVAQAVDTKRLLHKAGAELRLIVLNRWTEAAQAGAAYDELVEKLPGVRKETVSLLEKEGLDLEGCREVGARIWKRLELS